MSRFRFALSFAFAVAAGVGWLACIGDDPSSDGAKPQGELGGTCFPNKSCNAGLRCFQDVCVPENDGAVLDGASGDALSDASTEGAADAGDAADAGCDAQPRSSLRTACPGVTGNECPAGQDTCCGDVSCSTMSAANCSVTANAAWECSTSFECSTTLAKVCCMTAALTTTTACPPLEATPTSAVLCIAGSCSGGAHRLCATAAECDGGPCRPFTAGIQAGKVTLGICD